MVDSHLNGCENFSDRDSFVPFGQIASLIQFGRIGRRALMEGARLAAKLDPRIVPVVDDWDRMKPPLQNAVELDALCEAHDVDPARFIAVVGEAEVKFRNNVSILIAALNMPAIVAASAKRALTPNGLRDRKMLMELTGFLPVPASRQFRMPNQAAIKAEAGRGDVKPFPRFEDTVEIVEKALQDDK